jgi:gamma-glutamylcyclotransferase (GGCT)/AIG2-like uncharacterized protein YtfP
MLPARVLHEQPTARRCTTMADDREELVRLVAEANRARRAGEMVPASLVARLGDPDQRLVAYGTLRPGAPNEHVLADCPGGWTPAMVTGELGTWHGYPMLRPDAAGAPIDVLVLESADLPHAWRRLDRFEGPAYRREWIVYECDGVLAVGSVYVAR